MEMSYRDILKIQGIEKIMKLDILPHKPDNIVILHGIEFKIGTSKMKPKRNWLNIVDLTTRGSYFFQYLG